MAGSPEYLIFQSHGDLGIGVAIPNGGTLMLKMEAAYHVKYLLFS